MGKSTYKVHGGKLIRVSLETTKNRISKVQITGDFFLHPEETIIEIEEALKGCRCSEEAISHCIDETVEHMKAIIIGAEAEDFVKAILKAH